MNLFEDNTKSTNDNAIVNLPAGVNDLDIVGARLHTVKATQEKMVAMDFTDDTKAYSHFFACANANPERRRFAQGAVKAIWLACKLEGKQSLERLPNFVGKKVRMKVEHQQNGDDVFANIRGVWHPEDPDAPAPTGKQTGAISAPATAAQVFTSPDDQMPDSENPLAEEPRTAPAPQSVTTAPAASTKKWAKKTA